MEHKGLLSGMKVLDLSRVLAAPYCGMMLADLGAEVIKIERPGKGDDARSNFPIVNGESAYYMNLNRNKRGIVLNLKSQAGKEVFRYPDAACQEPGGGRYPEDAGLPG